MPLTFDDVERIFHVTEDIFSDGKLKKLCRVQVTTSRGPVLFKLSISKSPKGNPVLTMKALKPKTSEYKKKTLMGCPRESVQSREEKGHKKKKKAIGVTTGAS